MKASDFFDLAVKAPGSLAVARNHIVTKVRFPYVHASLSSSIRDFTEPFADQSR